MAMGDRLSPNPLGDKSALLTVTEKLKEQRLAVRGFGEMLRESGIRPPDGPGGPYHFRCLPHIWFRQTLSEAL